MKATGSFFFTERREFTFQNPEGDLIKKLASIRVTKRKEAAKRQVQKFARNAIIPILKRMYSMFLVFSGGSVVKNPPANAGDAENSIPGLGRSPEEGNGNPLQYSCLGNPMDRDWWATVHGVTKSQA